MQAVQHEDEDTGVEPQNYDEYAALQPSPNEIFKGVVHGESRAYVIAGELICGGIPFSFSPQVDDGYEFVVAKPAQKFLTAIIDHALLS